MASTTQSQNQTLRPAHRVVPGAGGGAEAMHWGRRAGLIARGAAFRAALAWRWFRPRAIAISRRTMDEAAAAWRHIAPMLIAAGRSSAAFTARVAGGLKRRVNIARRAGPSRAVAAMAIGRTERPRFSLNRRATLWIVAALVFAIGGVIVSGAVLMDMTGEWRARAALSAALEKADASPDMALARMQLDFELSGLESIRESGMASDDPVNSLALRQVYDQRLMNTWHMRQQSEQRRIGLAMSYLSNGKLKLIIEYLPEYASAAEEMLRVRRATASR